MTEIKHVYCSINVFGSISQFPIFHNSDWDTTYTLHPYLQFYILHELSKIILIISSRKFQSNSWVKQVHLVSGFRSSAAPYRVEYNLIPSFVLFNSAQISEQTFYNPNKHQNSFDSAENYFTRLSIAETLSRDTGLSYIYMTLT